MAQENTYIVSPQLFTTMKHPSCYKCNILFKIGDTVKNITLYRSRGKHKTRAYHKECWDKVLQ